MVGANLREEFWRKRLRWTAIDYHAKNYDSADDLTNQHNARDVDRLSRSPLANIYLDPTSNQIEAEQVALRNPLQSVVLADEVGLGKTIDAVLVQCQYWTEGSCGAYRLTPWSGWLMFAPNTI